jgi:hypothetical protein
MRMARHSASTPLLICRIVSISTEVKGITSITSMLPQWDDILCDRLREAVTRSLPPAPSVSDCAVLEGKCMSAWYSKLLDEEVKKSGGSVDVFAWLLSVAALMDAKTIEKANAKQKEIQEIRSLLPSDVKGMRQMLEEHRTQMVELARISSLPRESGERAAAEFEQRLKSAPQRNLFTEGMMRTVKKMRQHELKLANMTALLDAAFEVRAKGEAALPATLGTYRKTKGGFELTGRELFDGKPVVLTIGPSSVP